MARKGSAAAQQALGTFDREQLNAIDRAVGEQVRMRRALLGLSQEAVSKLLGLTFQQLQKYERGMNRISGSRLYQLALILHCPVSLFFETVEVPDAPKASLENDEMTAGPVGISPDLMTKRKTVEVVRAFYAIEDDRQRSAVLSMLKACAKAEE